MATFFGEVVMHPSRAVDDDDEEEEDETQSRFPDPDLKWQSDFQKEMAESAGKKFKCVTLVIAHGPAATGFADAYLLWSGAELVAKVDCDLVRSEVRPESAAGHRTCSVHRLGGQPQVLVCQCKDEVLAEIAHVWTEKIFADLDVTECQVVVMDTAPRAEYRSHLPSSEIAAPFLRCLRSKRQQAEVACPALEPPNIVRGLSAAVLSHCQVYNIRCEVYVGYLDSLFLHTDDIKVFSPLLSGTALKDFVQDNPNGNAVLQKLVERRALMGSLYT